MKKILHSIDELKMGGAQTHLITILEELKIQHPTDKHYILLLFGNNEFFKETSKLEICVIELHLENYYKKKKFLKAYQIIKNELAFLNLDVVETHLTWSRLFVNTAAFNLKIKKRIGFEHGDIYMNSIQMRISNFFSQFLFNKIIVCSQELKHWVKKTHKIQDSKLKVLNNCVNLSKFKPVPNKQLAKYLKISNCLPKYTFITVGSMGEGVNKRMDIIIKAIQKLRTNNIDAGLIICGDGKNREKLEQLSKNLKISDSIIFLGNRKDVHRIMPHCYAYVHSAPYEPFGIVCIEAMASGLPVILPDSGGIQKIITDKKEGYIYKALDEQALVDKILMLIDSDYQVMVTNAFMKVQEYDVTNYVKTLYSYYE